MLLYSNSYALVIGIDEYQNGWPRLSIGVSDARKVAAWFVDDLRAFMPSERYIVGAALLAHWNPSLYDRGPEGAVSRLSLGRQKEELEHRLDDSVI